jgi:hypothetical protein
VHLHGRVKDNLHRHQGSPGHHVGRWPGPSCQRLLRVPRRTSTVYPADACRVHSLHDLRLASEETEMAGGRS